MRITINEFFKTKKGMRQKALLTTEGGVEDYAPNSVIQVTGVKYIVLNKMVTFRSHEGEMTVTVIKKDSVIEDKRG